MLQARKVAVSIPDEIIRFFNRPSPSSLIMALGSTQPRREVSTRNFPGDKGGPPCKAENLTTILRRLSSKYGSPMGLQGLLQGWFSFFFNFNLPIFTTLNFYAKTKHGALNG
jgi:hypothetical protein